MTALASQLANEGCNVTYVAECPMSTDRIEQGWSVPYLRGVRLEYAPSIKSISMLLASAPRDSIHICQGLRGNGLIKYAQGELKLRGLRQWVVMETVDDAGWRGVIKRLEYRRLFNTWHEHLRGILAIGQYTPRWIAERGLSSAQIYPFGYFLKDMDLKEFQGRQSHSRFRFIFVGQFIDLKRLDLLLEALQRTENQNYELVVVGSGPLELKLKARAEKLLSDRVRWLGRLPMKLVLTEMGNADCLVLPSRHDGWGAVVSEAMMVGTPVICSNTCGSAGVVQASGKGGVFRSGDREELTSKLDRAISGGLVEEHDRIVLANWASCLGAKAGASYLIDILNYDNNDIVGKPAPPWSAGS
jgi:glycosyltransferase involved in cell wall biosynthesis